MTKHSPVIGCAFDPDRDNLRGNIESYITELTWYRPRGFGKLRDEGEALLRKPDEHVDWDWACEWMSDCDSLLTEWARKVVRHDYISYGPFEHGGAVGFYIYTDGAIEEADLKVDDLAEVPTGFTGLVVQVSDHGNVSGYQYSRGKARKLFAVV